MDSNHRTDSYEKQAIEGILPPPTHLHTHSITHSLTVELLYGSNGITPACEEHLGHALIQWIDSHAADHAEDGRREVMVHGEVVA